MIDKIENDPDAVEAQMSDGQRLSVDLGAEGVVDEVDEIDTRCCTRAQQKRSILDDLSTVTQRDASAFAEQMC